MLWQKNAKEGNKINKEQKDIVKLQEKKIYTCLEICGTTCCLFQLDLETL